MNPPYDAHFRTHWACWQARLSRQTWADAQSWPPLVREATLWPELLQRLRRATGAAAIVPGRLAHAAPEWRILSLPEWRAHWASERPQLTDPQPLVCPVGDRGHMLVGWPASAVWHDWPGRPALDHEVDWPLWLTDLHPAADWTHPDIAAAAHAPPPAPSAAEQSALLAVIAQASDWLLPEVGDAQSQAAPDAGPTCRWISTSVPLHAFIATWRGTGEATEANDMGMRCQGDWEVHDRLASSGQPDVLTWHWGLDHPADAISRLARCMALLRKSTMAAARPSAGAPVTHGVPGHEAPALAAPAVHSPLGEAPVAPPALLILLHGAMQGPQVFLPLMEHLPLTGLEVFRPTLPGSWPTMASTTPASLVPDLAKAVASQALSLWPRIPPERWCVVGHSMGSLVALELCRQQQQALAGLCLLGSAYPMPVSPRLLDGAAKDWTATQATLHWASLADPEHVLSWPGRAPLQTQALHDELMGASRPMSPERLAMFRLLFSGCDQYRWPGDWPPSDPRQLARLRVLIQGRDDRLTRLSQAEALGAALDAELHSIDAGHALLLEAPQAVAHLLTRLLLRQEPGQATP